MPDRISNRHESDLGGRLLPFGDTSQAEVTVAIDACGAGLASVQHTAWMLINLLLRQDGIVRRLHLICPQAIPLAGRVIPLARRNVDLRTALLEGGAAIGVVPIDDRPDPHWTIGIGADAGKGPIRANLYVYGNGWCGGISQVPLPLSALGAPSSLPFGPYDAACIAAGEVFKAARMRSEMCTAVTAAFYSLWYHRVSTAPLVGGPVRVEIAVDAALAGVGAVGSAFLHNLWACDSIQGRIVLTDNDEKGLESTNLNRYVLFGLQSIGLAKATAAARILSDAPISWQAHDGGIELLSTLPPRVISAVDSNTSRNAIQNRYPARILSASTLDLRAEVLRCGPPGKGACLRCYNPPETVPADDELRERLRLAGDDAIAEAAKSAGISVDDANEWLRAGKCGLAGERLLPLLRSSDNPAAFAVGFVSVKAGTMLAAEFFKDHCASAGPLSESAQRATFQFHVPVAATNRASAFARDPQCPMCDPKTTACSFWARRYEQLRPQRP